MRGQERGTGEERENVMGRERMGWKGGELVARRGEGIAMRGRGWGGEGGIEEERRGEVKGWERMGWEGRGGNGTGEREGMERGLDGREGGEGRRGEGMGRRGDWR